MSPAGQIRGKKVAAQNNIYTAVLALAFCVTLATVAFVAFKCFSNYGTILSLP